MHKINHANIKEWAKNYDGPLFDGILCDPPYELGFMGKSWDSSGIAFDTEMWADILKLLKPGAHLLAFSGSRTYHRMAVAIEDAGFEIRDMIEWVYGSGFPKSHNVANAVDKLGGASNRGHAISSGSQIHPTTGKKRANGELLPAYKARTEAGQVWEGYGTALKPAHEPCVLARKPISEKNIALNVLKHGTGGLNIDQCRVPSELPENRQRHGGGSSDIFPERGNEVALPSARFPANLIHDGSDEVEAVFPQTKSGKAGIKTRHNIGFHSDNEIYGNGVGSYDCPEYGDSGSAARFFYTAKASKSERNLGLDSTVSIRVQLEICENNITRQENLAQLQVVMDNSHLKATAESGIGTKSGTEWSMSLFGNQYTEKYPINTKSTTKTTTSSTTTSVILNWLIGLLTNESTLGVNLEMASGGSLVESAESSNTLIATINDQTALALGVNPAQANKRLLISVSDGKNFHSTVKPLSLTKYLATLIKPPTGGRLLVPFSGSGSEMIGALQAGWEYVEGVELTEEYIPIAEARIKYWINLKQAEVQQMELV